MIEIIIALTAFFGSCLTLFSGFGLGTILVPVFGLFFPIELAISLTAIVHFLNNLFKLILLGKHADKKIVIRFGIPSLIFSFIGAFALTLISEMKPLYHYMLFDKIFYILPVKLIIGILLSMFALFDIIPQLTRLQFDAKYLTIGGLLSGFFGGLSGSQGALRTAFLIRANLTKESFIATGVVIACLVDISRLSIYSKQLFSPNTQINYSLMIIATLSAFSGAYLGSKLLKKMKFVTLQYTVAVLLVIFSLLLGLGIL